MMYIKTINQNTQSSSTTYCKYLALYLYIFPSYLFVDHHSAKYNSEDILLADKKTFSSKVNKNEKPYKDLKPRLSVESTESVESAKSGESVESVESVESAESVESVASAKSVEFISSTESVSASAKSAF